MSVRPDRTQSIKVIDFNRDLLSDEDPDESKASETVARLMEAMREVRRHLIAYRTAWAVLGCEDSLTDTERGVLELFQMFGYDVIPIGLSKGSDYPFSLAVLGTEPNDIFLVRVISRGETTTGLLWHRRNADLVRDLRVQEEWVVAACQKLGFTHRELKILIIDFDDIDGALDLTDDEEGRLAKLIAEREGTWTWEEASNEEWLDESWFAEGDPADLLAKSGPTPAHSISSHVVKGPSVALMFRGLCYDTPFINLGLKRTLMAIQMLSPGRGDD